MDAEQGENVSTHGNNASAAAGHAKQQAATDSVTITASALSLADAPETAAEAAQLATPTIVPDPGGQTEACSGAFSSPATPATALAQAGTLRWPAEPALGHPPVDQQVAGEHKDRRPALAGVKSKSRNSRRAHKRMSKPSACDEGHEECIVCWSAASSIIFLPCGHICCCSPCAQPMLTEGVPCPMCRGAVGSAIALEDLQE